MPRPSPRLERQTFSAHLINKPKLKAIEEHHRDQGIPHLSMTRIVEELIDQEHKRLKL